MSQSKNKTTISVDEETWRRLQELKLELGVRSLNEVINKLMDLLHIGGDKTTSLPRALEHHETREL